MWICPFCTRILNCLMNCLMIVLWLSYDCLMIVLWRVVLRLLTDRPLDARQRGHERHRFLKKDVCAYAIFYRCVAESMYVFLRNPKFEYHSLRWAQENTWLIMIGFWTCQDSTALRSLSEIGWTLILARDSFSITIRDYESGAGPYESVTPIYCLVLAVPLDLYGKSGASRLLVATRQQNMVRERAGSSTSYHTPSLFIFYSWHSHGLSVKTRRRQHTATQLNEVVAPQELFTSLLAYAPDAGPCGRSHWAHDK